MFISLILCDYPDRCCKVFECYMYALQIDIYQNREKVFGQKYLNTDFN